MELEQKIVQALARFTTIEYEGLKEEALRGHFSEAAAQDFDRALVRLRDRGAIGNKTWFGPWWLERAASSPRKTNRTPTPLRRSGEPRT